MDRAIDNGNDNVLYEVQHDASIVHDKLAAVHKRSCNNAACKQHTQPVRRPCSQLLLDHRGIGQQA